MSASRYSAEEIERGLMVVVASAGNYRRASQRLKQDGVEVREATLRDWCVRQYVPRYQELREKYSAELEGQLVHELRESAVRAGEVQDLAIEKAYERLVSGKDEDPSKTAANLARVRQTSVDKMLAVSGRPTSIREDRRNPEEILRSLMAKYPQIISLPDDQVIEDEQPQLESSNVGE